MKSPSLHVPRWVATVAVVTALICGGVLALTFRDWSNHEVFGAPVAGLTLASDGAPLSLGNFKNGFASVLKPALPAVVNIHSSKVVKPRGGSPFSDPFFRQFFGDQFGFGQPAPQREESLGSGVILRSDGLILTNDHVINGASDIKVTLSNKKEYSAKVVGSDKGSDIAVLKIDATGLPVLPVGDSSKLQVGDIVFAIGEPFGLQGTATMGIVSATGRSNLGIESYEDFIQTDASINPGNSGGAMIDLHGDLVGINTAIESGGGGGNVGIGFAIPINMARSVMNQIIAHGKVIRGYLGIYIGNLTPELAKQFGYSGTNGVLVNDVSPDTPGARAGLRRGDIITAVNGEPMNTNSQLQLKISQSPPGTTVHLSVWRDGKSVEVPVTLGTLPGNLGQNNENNGPQGEQGPGVMKGVQVETLTPDIANQLNLPSGTHGVVIDSVDPSSSAAASGIQRGDVIQEVNHKPVNNVQQYRDAVSAAGNQSVLLLINHQGITSYIVVQAQ
ncbi:MAG: DegQ family serine endoprotease [Acidobacteriota bacterium]|nr:DegQ family serine endoprotease [Acidobacteriota bacterium]